MCLVAVKWRSKAKKAKKVNSQQQKLAGKEFMTYKIDDALGDLPGLVQVFIELQVLLERRECIACDFFTVCQNHMEASKQALICEFLGDLDEGITR